MNWIGTCLAGACVVCLFFFFFNFILYRIRLLEQLFVRPILPEKWKMTACLLVWWNATTTTPKPNRVVAEKRTWYTLNGWPNPWMVYVASNNAWHFQIRAVYSVPPDPRTQLHKHKLMAKTVPPIHSAVLLTYDRWKKSMGTWWEKRKVNGAEDWVSVR